MLELIRMNGKKDRTLTAEQEERVIQLTKQIQANSNDAVLHLYGSAGHEMKPQPNLSEWVKNLLNVLKKSGLHHVATVFDGKEMSAHQRGYGLGMLRAGLALMEKVVVNNKPDFELSKEGKTKIGENAVNALQDLASAAGSAIPSDKDIRKVLWLIFSEDDPRQAAEFFHGLADGLSYGQPESNRDTMATPVHMWLLQNWRAVEKFPNVPSLHRRYIAKGGNSKLFPLSRFAQICRRLKLHLSEAGRPRKKQSR